MRYCHICYLNRVGRNARRYDIRAEALDSWLENRWERWCDLHGDDNESEAKFAQTFETFLSAAFKRGEILPEGDV